MAENAIEQRLDFTGNIDGVLQRAADAYRLGTITDRALMPVGYEDCNMSVETEQGSFLFKVFNTARTDAEIDRYASILKAVGASSIRHPHLYEASEGGLVFRDHESSLSLAAMDFIEGKTFYDDGRRAPDKAELWQILRQAVLIHGLGIAPPYEADNWAIGNIQATRDSVADYIGAPERKIIDRIVQDFLAVDADALPHCFVHGDLTKSNCLKSSSGEIYVLDFSVANVYPRIQELAVIVGNLLNHPLNGESLLIDLEKVVQGYCKMGGKLTIDEAEALPVFSGAAYAMEYLGALREKHLRHDISEETDYWMEIGRHGLMKAYDA